MEEETKILSFQVNLLVLGFKEVPDRFRYLSKSCIIAFAGLFFLVIFYSINKSRLYIPGFEIFCLVLILITLVTGLSSARIRRKCPECKRVMRKLFPDKDNYSYSYKHYCGYCNLYVDTEVYNSDGD